MCVQQLVRLRERHDDIQQAVNAVCEAVAAAQR